MADPTDLGPNSPDQKDGHNHPARPHLCSPCSWIDFKALFTSHGRPIDEDRPSLKCKCSGIIEARDCHGWPGPESTDNSSEPPCCFCKFFNECLLRLKEIPFRSGSVSRPNSWDLRGFHSMTGFPIKHRECEDGNCSRHYAQDVYALRFEEQDRDGRGDRPSESTNNAILRVVDGPKFPGLTRERAAGGGLLARRIIPHQVNYNVIGEWLSLCHSRHVHCDGDDADVVTIQGFQVIDCTTTKILSAVDLLASGGEPGRVEYVTLSYVWGQAGEAGFHEPVMREDGLTLPNDLPLVISDAIEVVKRLGYRYLWIDRYCIPQNDSTVKHIQIRKMDRIYSCSVLTIVAAAGDGPEYGLPGVSSRHRTEQVSVQVTEEISLVFYEKPRALVAASKWNTRGWTYQEGLLSKRQLVFTDKMTYFQCNEMHGDEVLSLPLSQISFENEKSDFGCVFPRRITDWSNSNTAWDRIKQFALKQLAFDEDTLDAISGIFERYLSFNTPEPTEDRISFLCGLPVIPFSRAHRSNDHLRTTPTTTPLQKLGAGPYLPLFAADETCANPTCRLVNSFLWSVNWMSIESEFMGMPTDRQRHLRRPGFPSWTWAGWKHCEIKSPDVHTSYLYPIIIDSCITVHVEYEDEAGLLQRLDWVNDNERIHNLSHQKTKFPLYLLIKGTVMDMKLAWHIESRAGYPRLGGGCWIVTWPPFLKWERILAPRCLFEDTKLRGGDDKANTYLKGKEEVNVLGMTMAARCKRKGYATFVMILRPVTRLWSGQAETMYERAHLHEFHDRLDYNGLPIIGAFRETVVRLC